MEGIKTLALVTAAVFALASTIGSFRVLKQNQKYRNMDKTKKGNKEKWNDFLYIYLEYFMNWSMP